MYFYVHEIQTNANGSTHILTTKCDGIEQSKQKYYTVLAAASVSDVYKHSAVLMDEEGGTLKKETIIHRGATA